MLDVYMCPDLDCNNIKQEKKEGYCPECGSQLKKVGIREAVRLSNDKQKKTQENNQKLKREEYLKTEKGLNKLLFSDGIDDNDLRSSIQTDMLNLASHEAGTKWMRVGTLLSFNSTEQMIGAGFKALIDQNKIIIKQNEQILRALKNLNNE